MRIGNLKSGLFKNPKKSRKRGGMCGGPEPQHKNSIKRDFLNPTLNLYKILLEGKQNAESAEVAFRLGITQMA